MREHNTFVEPKWQKGLLVALFLSIVSLAACSAPHTTIRGVENQGMLRLTVKPADARVYVDGHDKGKASLYEDEDNLLVLSSGLHKLQIKKDGYTTYTREVFVGAGSIYEITTTLQKK